MIPCDATSGNILTATTNDFNRAIYTAQYEIIVVAMYNDAIVYGLMTTRGGMIRITHIDRNSELFDKLKPATAQIEKILGDATNEKILQEAM